jgi:hypothetical protein
MTSRLAPKARKSKLIVKELSNEVLIYDENNHQAHCLNETAALVWKFCDGRTSIPKMRQLLEKEMSVTVPEQTVWLALKQLEGSRLLDMSVTPQARLQRTSRRAVMQTMGIAAVALPLITSVRAAAAVAAASCVPLGQPCVGAGLGNCCPGASVACGGSPNGTCHVT